MFLSIVSSCRHRRPSPCESYANDIVMASTCCVCVLPPRRVYLTNVVAGHCCKNKERRLHNLVTIFAFGFYNRVKCEKFNLCIIACLLYDYNIYRRCSRITQFSSITYTKIYIPILCMEELLKSFV